MSPAKGHHKSIIRRCCYVALFLIYGITAGMATAILAQDAKIKAAPLVKSSATSSPQTQKATGAAAITALQLLKDSDRARGTARQGIKWDVTLESFEDSNNNKVDYLVRVLGDNAIAEATAPARQKGNTFLFNDRNMWMFKVGNKKPIAVSPRQKLAGEAANGDIASTNYYRDYEGKIVGEEKVDGKDTFKLELKAKVKNVTYDGIRYWISKKDHLGIKSEFMTLSGEIFKTATMEYQNTIKDGGKSYPFISKMTIVSAINAQNRAILHYLAPEQTALSESIFNVNNLVR